ncbi:MAG: adenosylmethionine--8-amino-7-oxononanoate transaminase [Phycisphaeraceae bacterium]
MNPTDDFAKLDQQYVWHPFTPMKQWRESDPLIIDRAEGFRLIDTQGRRYIDGVSSLWCNVHGHRVPQIDRAIREQLDKVAHTTLLGLASPPSIEFAAMLCERVNADLTPTSSPLNKVFYSDAGATAVEVAFKMAVGYWYHTGRPEKNRFIGLAGAYHGDTTGSMSVGFSELFHKPFVSMVFDVTSFPNPDAPRALQQAELREALTSFARDDGFPSENESLCRALGDYCLGELKRLLEHQSDQTAAVVIEPVMQGAAGMICQPPGFVKGVRELCDQYDVLLIADEVATGFGRTGTLFACEHDGISPDILCLAKGISGGYLPLAATLTTDRIEQAFCGELDERRTLYHGHTYTGNPLACAAAIASLKLFDENRVIEHVNQSARMIRDKLAILRDHPHVLDIRQRGLMVGIELCRDRSHAESFDFAARTGARICHAMRDHGLILRPLGDTLVLMPAPAMDHDTLNQMLDIVLLTLRDWRFGQ